MDLNLDEVLTNAWALLGHGVASRKHGFHFAAVATVGLSGAPRIRTVILRASDATAGTLRFHTDVRSQKCKDLEANPHVALVFYDEASKTQVRVEGVASLHTDDELADSSWKTSQPMSRLTYGTMPEPGLAIYAADRFSLPAPQTDVEWARPHFAAVLIRVRTLQWLYLKEGGQRCAVFDLESGVRNWTVPS